MFRSQFIVISFMFLCIQISVFAQIGRIRTGDLDTVGRAVKAYKIFDQVDAYLDIEYYDSADMFLNKISELYNVNETAVLNYYMHSRRAEVDYYNGLNQLGITNAKRGLTIAKLMDDRILLQDAYNLLGLLYVSMDSLQTAKDYFYKSISTIVYPPYPKQYLYQSMPYHIYGNMAEAYEKLKIYDSAYYFSAKSLQKATIAKNDRGIAIAYNSLARIYGLKKDAKAALENYKLSNRTAIKANENDILLLNQEGIASVYMLMGMPDSAKEYLQLGLTILDQNPQMNTYFKREFLTGAKKIYIEINDQIQLLKVTSYLLQLQEETNKRHFDQMQSILENSIVNEARFIKSNLEQEKKSKQLQINQLYIVVLVLFLLAIVLAFYQYSVKQKLKLSILKNKISQDLHDDVGASLSSITMSAALAEKLIESNPVKAKSVIHEISLNAEDGISTLSDIVWAMKPQSNSSTSLESKVKNYGYNLLSVNEIECSYQIQTDIETQLSNIEIRKNVLLVIKEAFNNIAKHSKAQKVMIKLTILNKNQLQLTIQDDGIGFNKIDIIHGNGLLNMEKRISDSKGKFSIESIPGIGTTIKASFNV